MNSDIRKVLDKADAIISDIEAIQSLPAGGAWYPSWKEIDAAVPGLVTKTAAEAVAKFAIDAFRERGGQVGGEVVGWQYQHIDPEEGLGGWVYCNERDYSSYRRPEYKGRFQVRELVVRGSGPVVKESLPTELETEVRAWLDSDKAMIRVREGGGPENLAASLAVNLARIARTSQPAVAGEAVAWQYRLHFLNRFGGVTEWTLCSADYELPQDHSDMVRFEKRALYDRPPSPAAPDDVMAAAEYIANELEYFVDSPIQGRANTILQFLKSIHTTHNAAAAKDAT